MSGPPARDGAKAPADQESMPTSPGHEAPQTEAKGGIGGLAGVFRGLTSSRQVRASPPNPTTSAPATVSALTASGEHSNASHPGPRLPQEQLVQLRKLQSGDVSERIAAAESLRSAVLDHPYTPVSSQPVPSLLRTSRTVKSNRQP